MNNSYNKIILGLMLFSMFFTLSNVYSQGISDVYYLIDITDTTFIPNDIHTGDIVSLAVDVKDVGTIYDIVNLKGTLDLGTKFESIQNVSELPLIKAGTTKTLTFKFKVNDDTEQGYYPIELDMEYLRNNELVKESQEIVVSVSNISKTISIETQTKKISPGEQTTMSFVLTNLSASEITNIDFSWSDSSDIILPIGSDDRKHISSIKSKESAIITYDVVTDPSTTTGIYPLSLSLSYNDTNGSRTITSTMGIIVGGGTDFDLSIESDGSNSYTINVVNIGKNDADAVSLVIPKQQGFTTTSTNTAVLGEINKGDFTVANFTIIKSTIPITNSKDANVKQNNNSDIIFEINYTDTLGDRQKATKTISMPNDTNSSFGNGMQRQQTSTTSVWTIILYILLFGSIIGAIGYYIYLKYMKNVKKK